MTMLAFHALFPDEAESECRTVMPFGSHVLPNRTFVFVEAYCVEPKCDCRRVMVNVIDAEEHRHVATINHGFEPPEPAFEDEGQTFLDPLNPQSSMSEAFLDLFEEVIASDEAYRQRLERHYTMWKRVVDDPSHPAQEKLGELTRRSPARRTAPKVGPNDPCPCGSSRKFKRCCRS